MSSDLHPPDAREAPDLASTRQEPPAELYNAVKQVLEKQQVLPLLRARLRGHVLLAMQDPYVRPSLLTELREDPDRRAMYLVLLLMNETLEAFGLEHSLAVFRQEIGIPLPADSVPLERREDLVHELRCRVEADTPILESMVRVMIDPDSYFHDQGQEDIYDDDYSSDAENQEPVPEGEFRSSDFSPPPGGYADGTVFSPHTRHAMEDNLTATNERSLEALNGFLDRRRQQEYADNNPNYMTSPTPSSDGFVTPTNRSIIASPQMSPAGDTPLSLDRRDSEASSFAGVAETWREDVIPPMQVALYRVGANAGLVARGDDDHTTALFQTYLTIVDAEPWPGEGPTMQHFANTRTLRYRYQDASPQIPMQGTVCEWKNDNIIHIPNAGKYSTAVFSFVRKVYSSESGNSVLERLEVLGQAAVATRSIVEQASRSSAVPRIVRFEAPTLELLGMNDSPTPYEMRDDFISQVPKLSFFATKYDIPSKENWPQYAGIENYLSIPEERMHSFYARFPDSYATSVTCRVQFPGQSREEKAFMPAWFYLVGDQMKIHTCNLADDEPIDRSQNSIVPQHRIRFPRRHVHAIFCFKLPDLDAEEPPRASPGAGQRKRGIRLPGVNMPGGDNTIQQENFPFCVEIQFSEPTTTSPRQDRGGQSPQQFPIDDVGRQLTRSESFNTKYKRIHLKLDSREAYQELVCALLTWSGLPFNVSPDMFEHRTRAKMQWDFPQLMPHSALVGWSAISATGSNRLNGGGGRLDSLQETEEDD